MYIDLYTYLKIFMYISQQRLTKVNRERERESQRERETETDKKRERETCTCV